MDECMKAGYSFIVRNTGMKSFQDLIDISVKIFDLFHLPISYFAVLFGSYEKPKAKSLKWNEKNLQKFEGVTYNEICRYRIVHNTTKFDYPTNFDLCIEFGRYSKDDSEREILLTYKTDYGILCDVHQSAGVFIKILSDSFEILRGFGTVMENEKEVEFFISGIGTRHFSRQQRRTAYSISANRAFRTYKLPDLFMVNILPRALMDDDLLKQIAAIIGIENVNLTDEKYVIFALPMTEEEYLDENHESNMRERLCGLLEQHQLLWLKELTQDTF